MAGPVLKWVSTPVNPKAVVLVLHGGYPENHDPVAWGQPPPARMLPFAWRMARTGRGQVAVVRLLHAERGWNNKAPLADARWALAHIADRYPGVPIGLLGHSMGGRTSLYLAADPAIGAIVTLGAWWEPSDDLSPDLPQHPGLRVLLIHGTRDSVTDPAGSQRAARDLRAAGVAVDHRVFIGEEHAMLGQIRRWHTTAIDYLDDWISTL